jgi:hypothetical protein
MKLLLGEVEERFQHKSNIGHSGVRSRLDHVLRTTEHLVLDSALLVVAAGQMVPAPEQRLHSRSSREGVQGKRNTPGLVLASWR